MLKTSFRDSKAVLEPVSIFYSVSEQNLSMQKTQQSVKLLHSISFEKKRVNLIKFVKI